MNEEELDDKGLDELINKVNSRTWVKFTDPATKEVHDPGFPDLIEEVINYLVGRPKRKYSMEILKMHEKNCERALIKLNELLTLHFDEIHPLDIKMIESSKKLFEENKSLIEKYIKEIENEQQPETISKQEDGEFKIKKFVSDEKFIYTDRHEEFYLIEKELNKKSYLTVDYKWNQKNIDFIEFFNYLYFTCPGYWFKGKKGNPSEKRNTHLEKNRTKLAERYGLTGQQIKDSNKVYYKDRVERNPSKRKEYAVKQFNWIEEIKERIIPHSQQPRI